MAKAKRAFMDGYATYDAESMGYGSARQWREAFNATMGFEEAARRVGARSPEELLGVASGASWQAIRTAYRHKAAECHPDRVAFHGLTVELATERFKELLAAYTLLSARYGKT